MTSFWSPIAALAPSLGFLLRTLSVFVFHYTRRCGYGETHVCAFPLFALGRREERESEQRARNTAALASFLLTTLVLPAMLTAPAECDLRIVHVVNRWYAAAGPRFFLDNLYSFGEQPTPTSPLLPEASRALRTALFTRHLQRILDALPAPSAVPDPSGAVPAQKKSNIVAVSVSPGLSRVESVGPLFGVGGGGMPRPIPFAWPSNTDTVPPSGPAFLLPLAFVRLLLPSALLPPPPLAPLPMWLCLRFILPSFRSRPHPISYFSFPSLTPDLPPFYLYHSLFTSLLSTASAHVLTVLICSYVLLCPILLLLTKSAAASVQSVLHVLFVPTAGKLSKTPKTSPAAKEEKEEALLPGAPYTECAVVRTPAIAPSPTTTTPPNSTSNAGTEKTVKQEEGDELETEDERAGRLVAHRLLISRPSGLALLAFGIGALALIQGVLAIAEGRYYITNPDMGTLVSFHKGDPILLSRAPVPPSLGQWTVKESGQDECTIINADATVYASENTLFTGNHVDTYSVEDAGFDEFVVRLVAKFFFLLYCPIVTYCTR
ncbi:hypothetical protein DFH08DRAFT_1081132 [Mycena albidolilacea]|uniref:Uncharacterized protein n=1 Tax=Mycena albidolilacea TaxID=1033008 RepID=A0AAD7EQH7_9AGAR|nr:hypothetical protein DFH08DRAFT_1081132 [Mycena albidolilacea]